MEHSEENAPQFLLLSWKYIAINHKNSIKVAKELQKGF